MIKWFYLVLIKRGELFHLSFFLYLCDTMSLKIIGEGEFNLVNTILTFNDTTGDYNASTNPTGWGGGINKTKAQVVTTQIRVIKPDGTIVDFTLNSATSPSSNFVPNIAVTREFSLTDLGEAVEFPDGVYQITYVTWVKIDDTAPAASYVLYKDGTISKVIGTSSNFTSVLLGFGDTSIVRIALESDLTVYEDFSIKQVVNNLNLTLDQVETKFDTTDSDGTNKSVILYAGYKSNFAVLDKNQYLKCFLPKIAGVGIRKSKGCGEPSCKSYKNDKEIQDLLEMNLGEFQIAAQLEYGMWDEANLNQQTLTRICRANKCGC
jgi:hypothetical protein